MASLAILVKIDRGRSRGHADLRPDPILVPPFLPVGSFSIGGVSVTAGQVIIIAIGLVLTGALYVFLQRYRLGIAMRAVVDDPQIAYLHALPRS